MSGNLQTVASNQRCQITSCSDTSSQLYQVNPCGDRIHIECLFENLVSTRFRYNFDDQSMESDYVNQETPYDKSNLNGVWCPVCLSTNPNRSIINIHPTAEQVAELARKLLSNRDKHIKVTAQSVIDWYTHWNTSQTEITALKEKLRTSLIQYSENPETRERTAEEMLEAITTCNAIIDPTTQMVLDHQSLRAHNVGQDQHQSKQESFLIGHTNEIIEQENNRFNILESLRSELASGSVHQLSTVHRIILLYLKLTQDSFSEDKQLQILETTDKYIKNNISAFQGAHSLEMTNFEVELPNFEFIPFDKIDTAEGRTNYIHARLIHNTKIMEQITALEHAEKHIELKAYLLRYAEQANNYFAPQSQETTNAKVASVEESTDSNSTTTPKQETTNADRKTPLIISPPNQDASWLNWIWGYTSNCFSFVYEVITWPYNYFFKSSE